MLELVTDLLCWGCGYVSVIKENQSYCVIKAMDDKPSWALDKDRCLLADFFDLDWFVQASVRLATVEDAEKVVKKIEKKYAKRLNPLKNGKCIDIVATDVNKAQGL